VELAISIGIDTSALSNLIGNAGLTSALLSCLNAEDRLYVPLNVIDETMSAADMDRLESRARELATLLQAFRSHIVLAPGGRELVVDYEWRTKRHYRSFVTPCLNRMYLQSLVSHLTLDQATSKA
jgi:hypothetical protein